MAGEDGLLDAFHNLHRTHVHRVVAGDQAELEDDDGRVQEDAVDDDHHEDESEDPRTADDKVKTGPEDERKAGDVGHPTGFADDRHQDRRAVVLELLEDVPGSLPHETHGRDDDGPEVQPTVSLEGDVDEHEELDAHPVRNCTEGRDEAECDRARETVSRLKMVWE